MKAYVLKSSVILALACSMVACAKEDGETDGDGKNLGPDGKPVPTGECSPDSDIPCYEGLAEPCANLDSGFEGDELCLAPPDPTLGFQLHVGPKDYDDPEQTDKYMIAAGDETNWAEIVTSINPETVYTRGYHSHMRPGSHHMIMYGLSAPPAGPGGPIKAGAGTESAVGAIGGVFLGGATKAIQNIDTKGELEEDQGIGSEVIPNRPVAVNLHFINTGEAPLLQEIWVNFILIDQADVTKYVKPITWYGGLGMNVAPGDHVTLTNAPNRCAAPNEMRLAMMIGHVHANTLRVAAHQYPGDGTEKNLLMEEYDWHDPTEWRFNNSTNNPLPDADAKEGGAASGIVTAVPGDTFTWECEIQNKSNVNLRFGNKVYDADMCNVFGFYFTDKKDAAPWTCAF